MHDVVLVQILDSGENRVDDQDRVVLGEFPLLGDALKKFTTKSEFEGQIVL